MPLRHLLKWFVDSLEEPRGRVPFLLGKIWLSSHIFGRFFRKDGAFPFSVV